MAKQNRLMARPGQTESIHPNTLNHLLDESNTGDNSYG